jgi:hypothetical protein
MYGEAGRALLRLPPALCEGGALNTTEEYKPIAELIDP